LIRTNRNEKENPLGDFFVVLEILDKRIVAEELEAFLVRCVELFNSNVYLALTTRKKKNNGHLVDPLPEGSGRYLACLPVLQLFD